MCSSAFLGVIMAKTGALTDRAVALIVGLMSRENALAMQVAFETGLRIGDILSLRTKQIKQKTFTVTEQKTGKKRHIKLSEDLKRQLQAVAGREYVFPGRLDESRPRTRQAVWKDIKRVERILENEGYLRKTGTKRHGNKQKGPIIGTHSGRKTFAQRRYNDGDSIERIRDILNHQRDEITVVYLMSQMIDYERGRKKRAPASELTETRK